MYSLDFGKIAVVTGEEVQGTTFGTCLSLKFILNLFGFIRLVKEISEKKASTWEILDAFIIPPFCRAHSSGEFSEVVTNGTPVESMLYFFQSVKSSRRVSRADGGGGGPHVLR